MFQALDQNRVKFKHPLKMVLPGFEGRDPVFLETNLPGFFADGDVRAGSTRQVASAAGEGAAAALLVREYLKTVLGLPLPLDLGQ